MPKRTNEFQQIILLLQHQLAINSVITESKMLKNLRTGSEAEVDIVIDSKVAGVDISVGIECTAKGRRATVEWIREMIAKHQDLKLDKSIFVSKSGFTTEALNLAEAYNIIVLTIEQATTLDWREMLDPMMFATFSFSIIGVSFEFDTSELNNEPPSFEKNPQLLEGESDSPIMFSEFVYNIVRNREVAKQALQKQLETPSKDHQDDFEFIVKMTTRRIIKIKTKNGTWIPIKSVTVKVKAQTNETPLSFTPGKYMGKSIAHGTAKNIAPESEDPEKDILVTFLKDDDNSTASILIPKFEGGDNKIIVMNTVAFGDKED